MSPETGGITAGSEVGGMNYKETELTLGLPGESRQKLGAKRGFSEMVHLLGSSRVVAHQSEEHSCRRDELETEVVSHAAAKSSKPKNQIVGWPPVRSSRQNMMMKPKKFVKVAVDGTPYLRKVDLEACDSYRQLLSTLGEMFTCFTISDCSNERKLRDPRNGSEYVPTYEDKDGDWMLVGDVPWKMFVESCKRVRLMKSSEASGIAPKAPPNCSSSSS